MSCLEPSRLHRTRWTTASYFVMFRSAQLQLFFYPPADDPCSRWSLWVLQSSSWSRKASITEPHISQTAAMQLSAVYTRKLIVRTAEPRERRLKRTVSAVGTRTHAITAGSSLSQILLIYCSLIAKKTLRAGFPVSSACRASLFTSTCPTQIWTPSHISTRDCTRLWTTQFRSYTWLQVHRPGNDSITTLWKILFCCQIISDFI